MPSGRGGTGGNAGVCGANVGGMIAMPGAGLLGDSCHYAACTPHNGAIAQSFVSGGSGGGTCSDASDSEHTDSGGFGGGGGSGNYGGGGGGGYSGGCGGGTDGYAGGGGGSYNAGANPVARVAADRTGHGRAVVYWCG